MHVDHARKTQSERHSSSRRPEGVTRARAAAGHCTFRSTRDAHAKRVLVLVLHTRPRSERRKISTTVLLRPPDGVAAVRRGRGFRRRRRSGPDRCVRNNYLYQLPAPTTRGRENIRLPSDPFCPMIVVVAVRCVRYTSLQSRTPYSGALVRFEKENENDTWFSSTCARIKSSMDKKPMVKIERRFIDAGENQAGQ